MLQGPGSRPADGSGPVATSEERQIWQNALPTMADSGEIDLRGLLSRIYRRRYLILLTMAAVMIGAQLWVSQVTPHYMADVLIVIEPQASGIVSVDKSVKDVGADDAKVKTETAILQSRGLAARVIEELALAEDPEFAPEDDAPGRWEMISAYLDEAWSLIPFVQANNAERAPTMDASAEPIERRAPGAAFDDAAAPDPSLSAERRLMELEKQGSMERTALLNRFLKRLTIAPEDGSRLVRITFRSTDAVKAATIANKLVDEYIESQLESKSEGARRAAEWLEVRLAEIGSLLKQLEQEIQLERTKSGSNAIEMVAKTQSQLSGELFSAQADVATRKARYQQVEDVLEGKGSLEALPQVIASGTVQGLRSRYTTLNSRLSDLRTVYGENHPDIVAIKAEMEDVTRLRDLEIGNILEGMLNEMRSAEFREEQLDERLQAVSTEMVRLNSAEASIEEIKERLRANLDLYKNLLRQHTEAVALRDNQQPDARIISTAQIPLKPSDPNYARVMILAFVGSASLSAFLLIIVERFRQRFDTSEDVEHHLGLPVIGSVPDLPRLWRMKSAPSDYMQREPMSEFGSAFQRLRALLVLGNNRKMPKRVLITSSTAGEGKTTAAVCFAVACVTAGQRVLLIDCDFGRPRLHETVDVENGKGLTDVMKGIATLDEAIARARGYSLSILTIGCSREGAIDLLNYGRMEELLNEIKDDYDTIVLDSAPVLEVSNALILGGLVEKTIMVVRRDWTSRHKALDAVRQLQTYGADIAGLVFNRTGAANT